MSAQTPIHAAPGKAEALRAFALTACTGLMLLVAGWTLASHWSIGRAALAVALVLPLLAPLPGLIRRNRRTYAWATLCVIPYFVLGLTEAVANPHGRTWSGTCLALALLLFGGLIGYLRVSGVSEGR